MSGYQSYWDRFRNDKVSTKSGTSVKTKSSFWFEQEDFDDSEWRGKSVSRTNAYVRDFDYFKPESNKDVLNSVACKVVRLLNSVRNSQGSESVLKVVWQAKEDAEGVSSYEKDVIRLSPDLAIQSEKSPELIDSLGGQCLISATQKRTINHTDLKYAISDYAKMKSGAIQGEARQRTECKTIAWQAIESSIATKDLLTEWPGAAPYIHRHKVANCASKDEVQNYVNSNKTVEGMVAAFSWTLNNPSNPIDIPAEIQPALDEALEFVLSKGGGSGMWEARYAGAANEVISIAQKTLEFKKGSGGGGGSDPNSGGGKGDEIPNSSDATTTIMTPKSDVVQADLPEAIKTTDNLDIFDVPKIPPGAGKCLRGKRYDLQKITDSKSAFASTLGSKENYEVYKNRSRKITESVLNALRFRANEISSPIFAQASGDIDEGSLFKLAERRGSDFRIYQKNEHIAFPHVLFGMLIDQSGSMSRSTNGSTRIEDAKTVCVGIHEALKKIKKVDQYIAGHDANGSGYGKFDLYEYITSPQSQSRHLSRAENANNNADGYAIQWAVERMVELYPDVRNRSLCVISDGKPHASGVDGNYGEGPAFDHIKNVCDWAWRKHKVRVVGIGVANAFSEGTGERMYGKGNCVVLSDVISSALVISRFLQKVTSKTR